MRRKVPLVLVVAAVLAAPSAGADVTSWLALGAGMAVDRATGATSTNPAFSASLGVGSDPTHAWVLGGVFRTVTRFSEGTDLNLSARLTTGGFSRGDWGIGLDVGPGLRLWGNDTRGTYPLQGALLLGAPWGLQLSMGADMVNLGGTPASVGGYAVLEFDFLRFTLMRQGSTDTYWRNPLPAGGPVEPSGPAAGH